MAKNTVVVDSSVIIKWLSKDKEGHRDQADKILEDAQNDRVKLITPELAKYEVGNVLLFSKNLSLEQGTIVLKQLFALPIKFVTESEQIATLTYAIASLAKITYYDAAFLSLAKQYDATLVTDNVKHQGKTKDVKVLPLADY